MFAFKKSLKKLILYFGFELINVKYRDKNASIKNRIDEVLEAKKNMINDFFGGWEIDDINLLNKYKYSYKGDLEEGYIYDWLGVKTAKKFHGWIENPEQGILFDLALPVPDDKIHAEAIEYIALATSFEQSKDKISYTMVELGASFSPWCSSAGVVAERLGFKSINLISVEASSSGKDKIYEQFSINKLVDNPKVTATIIEGAVAVKNGFVYFPKVNVKNDNGAQISAKRTNVDYRGLKLEYDKVNSYSLNTITKNFDNISFLHMDLQGAEEALIENKEFIDCIDKKVKVLFLASQSRIIEGKAVKALFGKGWRLFRERPTTYKQNDTGTDPNGWTLRDGGQIWINNKI